MRNTLPKRLGASPTLLPYRGVVVKLVTQFGITVCLSYPPAMRGFIFSSSMGTRSNDKSIQESVEKVAGILDVPARVMRCRVKPKINRDAPSFATNQPQPEDVMSDLEQWLLLHIMELELEKMMRALK